MLNTIGENSKINTYSVSNENTVTVNSTKAEKQVGSDNTAAILSLSEEAYGDGVVTVKSSETRNARISNQAYHSYLSSLGFYTGAIDGNLSSTASVKALKNFQKVYGLLETGTANSSTLNMLENVYNDYIELYTSDSMDSIATSFYYGNDNSRRTTFAKVYTFLKNSMCLTKHQIAGVMGNMQAESGIITDNVEDNYYPGKHNPEYVYNAGDYIGFGLIQWTSPDRKEGLETVADSMQLDESNISEKYETRRQYSATIYNAISSI